MLSVAHSSCLAAGGREPCAAAASSPPSPKSGEAGAGAW